MSVGTNNQTVILGGGLTGLSAGHVLTRAGQKVVVLEADQVVGGLSRTVLRNGFRFDLGGHRFFTTDRKIGDFVRDLMGDELVSVSRRSKIYMRRKYFDYPLRPFNAMFGLGIPTTIKIISDYGNERIKSLRREGELISLEDWVVANFGRKMYSIYFKEYSEKVWGIPCSMISAEWVSQRIRGLSLAKAVKNALFRFNGRDLPTLADTFVYPRLGIGRISDRLRDEIVRDNEVHTGTRVSGINHSDFTVRSVMINNNGNSRVVSGREFISSIPLTNLVQMLRPAPPQEILTAADGLRFRDLVVVVLMLNKKRVTDQTWIYIPERHIPFGRIHEPTNWSEEMAPQGKTLMVMEYFSFAGDNIWNEKDESLIATTTRYLDQLDFVKKGQIIDGVVVRVPKAYPLFEVGYQERSEKIYDYLKHFKNLHIAGRSGMFRYYNMDHALASGIATADEVMKKTSHHELRKPFELVSAGVIS